MSAEDRDNAQTRANIERVAKGYHELVKRAGNNDFTFEQAKKRVSGARRKGDMKRDNKNR
jgi:hypothetical protein